MRRSSWGLSSAPEAPAWERSARCADPAVNPDWWSGATAVDRGKAVHECLSHCPVFAACRNAVLEDPRRVAGTVRAGVYYVGSETEPTLGCQPKERPCGECARKRRDAQVWRAAKDVVVLTDGGVVRSWS